MYSASSMPPTRALPPIPKAVARAVAQASTTHKLTAKQAKFTALVAAGAQQAEAYRQTYNTGNHPTTVITSSSKLASKPNIAATIEAGRIAATLSMAQKGAQVRETIADNLSIGMVECAEAGRWNEYAKLAKLAGEQAHVQAFAKRRDAEDAAQLTDFMAELRSLRVDLADSGLVIDIKATESEQITQAVDSTLALPEGETVEAQAASVEDDARENGEQPAKS